MHSNKAFGRLSNDGKLHDDKAFRRSAARPITTPTTTIFSRARWTLNDRIWTIPGFSICGRQVCTNGFLPGGNSFESKSNRWLFRFSYRIVFTFFNRCYYFAHDSLRTPFHFFFFFRMKEDTIYFLNRLFRHIYHRLRGKLEENYTLFSIKIKTRLFFQIYQAFRKKNEGGYLIFDKYRKKKKKIVKRKNRISGNLNWNFPKIYFKIFQVIY